MAFKVILCQYFSFSLCYVEVLEVQKMTMTHCWVVQIQTELWLNIYSNLKMSIQS